MSLQIYISPSADILVLELRCNEPSAYTERPTPLPVEEEYTLLYTYTPRRD
jgi:hypothetical protein